ncbi:MAG: glycerol-3-phosphate dehydrogenase/oxidase [Candidatus Dormibacteraeota bacterium]|nr:glycerol-3-phosphate dehydrogenase/oxidase [Candidatus Dormibacteraeota bacterium]
MSFAGSLNAAQRATDIARIAADELDVLVIGGGITGTGVALDAAMRGLRTGLVERRDLANGTSRWSSKLIHGGLRYLRQGQLGIAWESARERHILMTTTAPHLVHPLPFIAPLNSTLSPLAGALTEVGVRAGDVLRLASGTRRRQLPGPRRIGALEAQRLVGGLRTDDLRGAVLFWDGQVEDDARLVIAAARTAASEGAAIATHCTALSSAAGRVQVRDEIGGTAFEVRARTVVNACGVWAGTVDHSVRLRPSKGAHLVVDACALLEPRAALITPVLGESARWVGATPTGDGRVIVGVTDDAFDGPIDDEPAVEAEEEEFLLTTLSRALQRPLTDADVLGRYAGFRPLLDTGGGSTADLSRSHSILESPDGTMLTVVGGKLTTYRRMAQDAVDRVVARHGGPRSSTASRPLIGAGPRGVATGVPVRLVRRYGSEAEAVARLAAHDRALLEPVFAGTSVLGVELLFGILHEGAMDIDDLLDRRVRLGLVPAERRRAEALATDLFGVLAA